MAARTEKLSVHSIKVIEKRHRPIITAKVELIAASLAEIGQRYPISVYLGQNGPVLVAGLHRLEAAKLLGWKKIQCHVVSGDKIDRRLWTLAENAHRADLTTLQRAEHTVEWDRLVQERAKDGQLARPGGRQPKDRGISKSAKRLGLSREEVRRARSIATITSEAKAKIIELKLDRKQSALLEIGKEDTAADQIAKAEEIVARNRRAKRPLAAKATERHSQKYGALGSTSPAKVSVDPAPPAKSSEGGRSTHAHSPEKNRSLVPLEKPPARTQSRMKFAVAVRELKELIAKPSEDFVGVVQTADLELVANFLVQIAAASKKAM